MTSRDAVVEKEGIRNVEDGDVKEMGPFPGAKREDGMVGRPSVSNVFRGGYWWWCRLASEQTQDG